MDLGDCNGAKLVLLLVLVLEAAAAATTSYDCLRRDDPSDVVMFYCFYCAADPPDFMLEVTVLASTLVRSSGMVTVR